MKNGNNLYSAREVFGQTLEARRKEHGLTQEELADMLGLSAATIVSWEAGRYSPRDRNLDALTELLGNLETVTQPILENEHRNSNVKAGDVEAALIISQSMEEILVTAQGFADDKMQGFIGLLLSKVRTLNGRLIAIKAGLRD